ncbi:hypothetical protein [Mesorhizobium salmacidum]|uniref:Uncharacterized protein n=1 Tax=Mesorhizobium salmacidum TaxID=3015171 RepID=A0ABU8KSL6_9HYPH
MTAVSKAVNIINNQNTSQHGNKAEKCVIPKFLHLSRCLDLMGNVFSFPCMIVPGGLILAQRVAHRLRPDTSFPIRIADDEAADVIRPAAGIADLDALRR